jgi:WhiB family redox-sensing transcriptional regulator
VFFPGRGGNLETARAIRESCPVRRQCLEYALGDGDDLLQGIWDGTSQLERMKLRRAGKVSA